jgi:hypothetical protein
VLVVKVAPTLSIGDLLEGRQGLLLSDVVS